LKIFGQKVEYGKLGKTFQNSLKLGDYSNMVKKNFRGKIPGLREKSTANMTVSRSTKDKKFIIEFDISSYDYDIGQSFVPFFDAEKTKIDKSVPLSGIELMHYTNDRKYAGFIKPYLIAAHFKDLIDGF
jgi:hypothetical protein